jgi:hypothetical protein
MARKQKKEIYMNNPALPTVDAQFEWSPEMVSELKKCKENILHFAENHFYIINTDEGKQKIKLHPYQKKALRMIRDQRFSIMLFSRQTGKCLKNNTLCKIMNKKTGELQELTIEKIFNISAIETEKQRAEKFIESHKVEDYKIWSDEGWVDIQEVHKTIKFDVWIVETENFKLQCADEHIVIGKNREEIYVKDLKIGDEIITENGIESVIRVEKLDVEPEHMYDLSIDSENHTFFSNGILSHNSTLATIFMLWVAIFNDDQKILLVANKENTAAEIFRRIRIAYEGLPNWLKAPVTYYGLESLELQNGSRINITTTTGTAARGSSVNLLFIDELAFIPQNMMSEFWSSVYPIISSSKKAKIIIASTPKDTSGLLYELYDASVKGENNWANMKVLWSDVPGRDEKWKKDTMAALGDPAIFSREFECAFDEVGESAIDQNLFDDMRKQTIQPLYVLDDGTYHLWEKPNPDKIYVAGVDVSEGVGKDASVVQVLDITEPTRIKQVAVYHNNKISPTEFTPKLREILQHWGDPLAMIERNNCGAQVVDNLKREFSYENIVNWGVDRVASRKSTVLGIISHTNTRYHGIMNQRYWVNTVKTLQLNDVNTVLEMKDFIKTKSGKWEAKHGAHDDRVMSLVWALMILHEDLVNVYFDVVEKDEFGKPRVIKTMDYGIRYFNNPLSIYTNEKDGIGGDAMPMVFGGINSDNTDMDDLINGGWKPLIY